MTSKVKKIFSRRSRDEAPQGGEWSKTDEKLMASTKKGDLARVQSCLKKGADPLKVDPLNGATALHEAGGAGNIEVIEALLVASGGNVNVRDSTGKTPLCYAVMKGQTNAAMVLLKARADPAFMDSDGVSAMHHATHGNMDCVQLLLKYNAPFDLRDTRGRTPLSYAAANGQASVCKLLLAMSADVNNLDESLNSPLICASRNGNAQLCQYLLDQGADPGFVNAKGLTALQCAIDKEHVDVRRVLEAALARPTHPTDPPDGAARRMPPRQVAVSSSSDPRDNGAEHYSDEEEDYDTDVVVGQTNSVVPQPVDETDHTRADDKEEYGNATEFMQRRLDQDQDQDQVQIKESSRLLKLGSGRPDSNHHDEEREPDLVIWDDQELRRLLRKPAKFESVEELYDAVGTLCRKNATLKAQLADNDKLMMERDVLRAKVEKLQEAVDEGKSRDPAVDVEQLEYENARLRQEAELMKEASASEYARRESDVARLRRQLEEYGEIVGKLEEIAAEKEKIADEKREISEELDDARRIAAEYEVEMRDKSTEMEKIRRDRQEVEANLRRQNALGADKDSRLRELQHSLDSMLKENETLRRDVETMRAYLVSEERARGTNDAHEPNAQFNRLRVEIAAMRDELDRKALEHGSHVTQACEPQLGAAPSGDTSMELRRAYEDAVEENIALRRELDDSKAEMTAKRLQDREKLEQASREMERLRGEIAEVQAELERKAVELGLTAEKYRMEKSERGRLTDERDRLVESRKGHEAKALSLRLKLDELKAHTAAEELRRNVEATPVGVKEQVNELRAEIAAVRDELERKAMECGSVVGRNEEVQIQSTPNEAKQSESLLLGSTPLVKDDQTVVDSLQKETLDAERRDSELEKLRAEVKATRDEMEQNVLEQGSIYDRKREEDKERHAALMQEIEARFAELHREHERVLAESGRLGDEVLGLQQELEDTRKPQNAMRDKLKENEWEVDRMRIEMAAVRDELERKVVEHRAAVDKMDDIVQQQAAVIVTSAEKPDEREADTKRREENNLLLEEIERLKSCFAVQNVTASKSEQQENQVNKLRVEIANVRAELEKSALERGASEVQIKNTVEAQRQPIEQAYEQKKMENVHLSTELQKLRAYLVSTEFERGLNEKCERDALINKQRLEITALREELETEAVKQCSCIGREQNNNLEVIPTQEVMVNGLHNGPIADERIVGNFENHLTQGYPGKPSEDIKKLRAEISVLRGELENGILEKSVSTNADPSLELREEYRQTKAENSDLGREVDKLKALLASSELMKQADVRDSEQDDQLRKLRLEICDVRHELERKVLQRDSELSHKLRESLDKAEVEQDRLRAEVAALCKELEGKVLERNVSQAESLEPLVQQLKEKNKEKDAKIESLSKQINDEEQNLLIQLNEFRATMVDLEDRKKAELDVVERERDRLKAELNMVERERDRLKAELNVVERERDRLKAELNVVERERDRLKAELSNKHRELLDLSVSSKSSLADKDRQLNKQIAENAYLSDEIRGLRQNAPATDHVDAVEVEKLSSQPPDGANVRPEMDSQKRSRVNGYASGSDSEVERTWQEVERSRGARKALDSEPKFDNPERDVRIDRDRAALYDAWRFEQEPDLRAELRQTRSQLEACLPANTALKMRIGELEDEVRALRKTVDEQSLYLAQYGVSGLDAQPLVFSEAAGPRNQLKEAQNETLQLQRKVEERDVEFNEQKRLGAELRRQLEGIRNENLELRGRINELEAGFGDKDGHIMELRRQLDAIRIENLNLQRIIGEGEADLFNRNSQVAELSRQLEGYPALALERDLLKHELDASRSDLNKAQKLLENKDNERLATKVENELEKIRRVNDSLMERLRELEVENEKQRQTIGGQEKKLTELYGELAKLSQTAMEKQCALRELEEVRLQLNEAQRQLAEREVKVEHDVMLQTAPPTALIDTNAEELEDLRRKVKQLEKERERREAEMKELKQELARKEERAAAMLAPPSDEVLKAQRVMELEIARLRGELQRAGEGGRVLEGDKAAAENELRAMKEKHEEAVRRLLGEIEALRMQIQQQQLDADRLNLQWAAEKRDFAERIHQLELERDDIRMQLEVSERRSRALSKALGDENNRLGEELERLKGVGDMERIGYVERVKQLQAELDDCRVRLDEVQRKADEAGRVLNDESIRLGQELERLTLNADRERVGHVENVKQLQSELDACKAQVEQCRRTSGSNDKALSDENVRLKQELERLNVLARDMARERSEQAEKMKQFQANLDRCQKELADAVKRCSDQEKLLGDENMELGLELQRLMVLTRDMDREKGDQWKQISQLQADLGRYKSELDGREARHAAATKALDDVNVKLGHELELLLADARAADVERNEYCAKAQQLQVELDRRRLQLEERDKRSDANDKALVDENTRLTVELERVNVLIKDTDKGTGSSEKIMQIQAELDRCKVQLDEAERRCASNDRVLGEENKRLVCKLESLLSLDKDLAGSRLSLQQTEDSMKELKTERKILLNTIESLKTEAAKHSQDLCAAEEESANLETDLNEEIRRLKEKLKSDAAEQATVIRSLQEEKLKLATECDNERKQKLKACEERDALKPDATQPVRVNDLRSTSGDLETLQTNYTRTRSENLELIHKLELVVMEQQRLHAVEAEQGDLMQRMRLEKDAAERESRHQMEDLKDLNRSLELECSKLRSEKSKLENDVRRLAGEQKGKEAEKVKAAPLLLAAERTNVVTDPGLEEQVKALTESNARVHAELLALQQQQGLANQLDGAAVTSQGARDDQAYFHLKLRQFTRNEAQRAVQLREMEEQYTRQRKRLNELVRENRRLNEDIATLNEIQRAQGASKTPDTLQGARLDELLCDLDRRQRARQLSRDDSDLGSFLNSASQSLPSTLNPAPSGDSAPAEGDQGEGATPPPTLVTWQQVQGALDENSAEINRLEKRNKEMEKKYVDVITTYRTHLLSAMEGGLDPDVRERLMRILQMRPQIEIAAAARKPRSLSSGGDGEQSQDCSDIRL